MLLILSNFTIEVNFNENETSIINTNLQTKLVLKEEPLSDIL